MPAKYASDCPAAAKAEERESIYAVVLRATALVLLDVYTKNDQENLTALERKQITKLIRAIESGPIL